MYVNGIQQKTASKAAGKTDSDYSLDEIKTITAYDKRGVIVNFIDNNEDGKYNTNNIVNVTLNSGV